MVQVYNHDVAGVVSRIDRFIVEMIKQQSANVADMNSFDQNRLATYLNALDVYVNWVQAQPALDLPESHPSAIDVGDVPTIPELENEAINDVVRLFVRLRIEITASQSARMASKLISFDESRVRALVLKTRNFLTDYIAVVQPLDLPESSPSVPDSGPGAGGINP